MTDYEDIKARLTLSTAISPYTPLKKYATDKWKGLCPFHQEKTPSFYVHDDLKFYKCFGCGASGDIIGFVQQIEGISHADAVKRLKAEAGIEDHFMTVSQKREMEIAMKKRKDLMKSFRAWKNKIVDDLIIYTNAQWSMYRVATRQFRVTPTDELESQITSSMQEAMSRESALDTVDAMSDREMLDWYQSRNTWMGVKNPRWFLTAWRKEIVDGFRKK